MHTITNCSRCGIDFMYHCSETNLYRSVAFDADTKEPCSFEIICQHCHEVEENPNYLAELFSFSDFETYKLRVIELWNDGDINELQCDGLITIGKEVYDEEGRLTKQSMRLLTEKEFNARFTTELKINTNKGSGIKIDDIINDNGFDDIDLPF